jgi:hypothetical protein
LKKYNYLSPVIEMFLSRMNELNYKYYASELLYRMLRSNEFDLDTSIRKAIAILRLTGIPVQNHFFCIYRSDSTAIKRDWKLSELACSLVIIIHESTNSEIEEFQEELMSYLGV